MLPKPPPREGQLGFLYVPPYRVQGTSIAGEATALQVPELDIGFDMGSCPRSLLSSKYVAISHGHMDHIGGLAYFCSQRHFQGMGVGNIVCDKRIESAMQRMLTGYIDLEQQRTPFNIIALEPEQEIEIKNTIFLRAIQVEHAGPAFGYTVIERRSKLKEEFVGFPQEKLRELKESGTEITRILEVPLVAYLGDTLPGPWLLREDVLNARVVISECTFVEDDHKDRARIGRHMHLDDVIEWLPLLRSDALILTHLSRRSNIATARKLLQRVDRPNTSTQVHFLMDHRANRALYERQVDETGATV
ncbi:MAG: MBL fold metallo-hydrolase [Planctomycetota bacterium]|jgi:ribonuclease Z